MIEPLPDLPGDVLGFVASGHVTASDYESVLIPAIESALKERRTLRLLYQIGPGFAGFAPGAVWDDAKVGLSHWSAWERVAIVTDVDWIATAVKLFGFAMPRAVKVFKNAEYADAVRWLTE